MTIASEVSRISYVLNGATTVYPYPFRLLEGEDVEVLTRSAVSGIETTLGYNVGYTVSGVGNTLGGSVTLTSAGTSGDTLVIRRNRALTQETSLASQGRYSPTDVEFELDAGRVIDQQLQDQLDRTFRLPDSVNPAVVSFRTPVPAGNTALAWNSAGTALENRTLDSTSVALPGNGRTVATVTAYLDHNKVFNVRDYGALGDYVTNDAPAIQAAHDAAELVKGTVYFPEGNYRIATSIRWASNVTLEGANYSGSVIDCQVTPLAAPLIVAKYLTQPLIYSQIRDLSLRGGTYGIDFGFGVGGYAQNLVFERVGFQIQTVGAIRCNAEFDTSEWHGCSFDHCVSGIQNTASVFNHNSFFNTEFLSLTGTSFDISKGEVVNFTGCRFEGDNGAALGGITVKLNDARNINFRGCYFESHRQTLISETASGNGVSFDGCHFSGASNGAGGFTEPLFVSDGIILFGSNSGFTAMSGPTKLMVTGLQSDQTGWSFGAQSQKLYITRTKQRQHFVSSTPTIATPKDLLVFTRSSGSDSANTNQQKVSGRLRINAVGVTGAGFDYQYSREYQITLSAIGIGTMGATILQIGAGMDTLRGSTLTIQQKAGATSTSLTIEAVWTSLGVFVGSEMQWEWEGISTSSHVARYISADLP